jgi:hypothetical protein
MFSSSVLQIIMGRHRFTTEEISICRRSLLAWYDANKRQLPWRDWHDIDKNIVAYRGLKKRNYCHNEVSLFSFVIYSTRIGIDASTNSSGYCYSIL